VESNCRGDRTFSETILVVGIVAFLLSSFRTFVQAAMFRMYYQPVHHLPVLLQIPRLFLVQKFENLNLLTLLSIGIHSRTGSIQE